MKREYDLQECVRQLKGEDVGEMVMVKWPVSSLAKFHLAGEVEDEREVKITRIISRETMVVGLGNARFEVNRQDARPVNWEVQA